jgi:NRPS condensation-like uncharacterized protein
VDYRAEVFDQIQFLFERNGFNDHQLHCVLQFEHGLNEKILKEAVIASIEAIPILGARFIEGAKPRWTSLDPKELDRAFVIARTEMEFNDFVVSRVDEGIGPQIRLCTFNAASFAVALKMNHMVCDAADFKRYLYYLCAIYSRLITEPGYRPSAISGDRSMRRVLKHFGLGVKLKSMLLQSDENNLTGSVRFPLSDQADARPFILTRKLERERTAALKDFGRAEGATLNDLLLTAFYRSLFQRLALSPGAVLQIPVMVDMRRYLGRTEDSAALTNLASTVLTQLECRPEERFEATLGRAKAAMDKKKSSNLGLNGFIKLDLMYRVLGDQTANRLLRSKLKNPLICMTNVGILDSNRICFGGLRPRDAFLCGSIKYKPYFQLAMSSYDGELTLSANLSGNNSDRDSIQLLLGEIDAELSAWEQSRRAGAGVELPSPQSVFQQAMP